MKTESLFFALIAVFGAVMGPIYGFVTDWNEPVGVVGLLLAAALGAMVAFYEIEGDYGAFAPYSWWPLWLGLAAALIFMGVAVGWWIVAIGVFMGVFALIGWTFESYKGQNAL